MPPLRERSDIEDLINGILIELRASVTLSPEAGEALKTNHWPGNIRQLKNVLSVALALCDGEQLNSHHLPDELRQAHECQLARPEGGDRSGNSLATAERNALEQALLSSNWNVTATAAGKNAFGHQRFKRNVTGSGMLRATTQREIQPVM